jgi:undecaprenyl pyrophosphate phosphatase UppP
MLLAVGCYFLLVLRLPVSSHPAPGKTFEIAIALLSLSCVNTVFYFNRKYVGKAEVLMRQTPGDDKALKRWRVGYMAIYAASFAVALYGLLLHFLGAPIQHVVPFFIVGAALIIWFRPRVPRDMH